MRQSSLSCYINYLYWLFIYLKQKDHPNYISITQPQMCQIWWSQLRNRRHYHRKNNQYLHDLWNTNICVQYHRYGEMNTCSDFKFYTFMMLSYKGIIHVYYVHNLSKSTVVSLCKYYSHDYIEYGCIQMTDIFLSGWKRHAIMVKTFFIHAGENLSAWEKHHHMVFARLEMFPPGRNNLATWLYVFAQADFILPRP